MYCTYTYLPACSEYNGIDPYYGQCCNITSYRFWNSMIYVCSFLCTCLCLMMMISRIRRRRMEQDAI